MLILPAIDLIDGQVVRLYKGNYEQKKVYSSNPVNKAKEFEKLGAKYIHIVDLDGAREGKNINTQTIKKMSKIKWTGVVSKGILKLKLSFDSDVSIPDRMKIMESYI